MLNRWIHQSPIDGSTNQLEEYIKGRDYTGALALLEFNRKVGEDDELHTLLWIGYCAFHLGQYQKAFDRYQEVVNHHIDAAPTEVRK